MEDHKFNAWLWIRQNALVVVGILASVGSATVFIITFYIRSSDSWNEIKTLKEQVKAIQEQKADKAAVQENQKNVQDRLQRQYEQNNTRDARITEIEKDAAYERGRHDSEKGR